LRANKLILAAALFAAASTTVFAQQKVNLQDSERNSGWKFDPAQASIRLPPDFLGCWEGTIKGDDFKPATPGATIARDPATYELC
jgi:hypothetical protein